MNYVVISFGIWVLASQTPIRKGKSRHRYSEPHHIFGQVRRVQLQVEGSVLTDNIEPIF